MSNSSQLNVLNNDFTLTITDEAAKLGGRSGLTCVPAFA